MSDWLVDGDCHLFDHQHVCRPLKANCFLYTLSICALCRSLQVAQGTQLLYPFCRHGRGEDHGASRTQDPDAGRNHRAIRLHAQGKGKQNDRGRLGCAPQLNQPHCCTCNPASWTASCVWACLLCDHGKQSHQEECTLSLRITCRGLR